MERWIDPNQEFENPGFVLEEVKPEDFKEGVFLFYKGHKFKIMHVNHRHKSLDLYYNYYNYPAGISMSHFLGKKLKIIN